MAKTKKNKLKIGLIVNNAAIPEWISQLINKINNSSYASTDLLLILNSQSKEHHSATKWQNSLYALYCKMEEYRWSGKDEDCLGVDRKFNSADEFKEVISIDLTVPDKELIDQKITCDLDILLNLTDQKIPKQLSFLSNQDIWFFYFQNTEAKMRTFPTGFWEAYDGSSTMEFILCSTFSVRNDSRILYRSLFATDDRSSQRMNQSKAYRIASTAIFRKLNQLVDKGPDSFLLDHKEKIEDEPLVANNFRCRNPGNLRMLTFFGNKFLNSLKMRLMNRLFTEQWAMRYRLADGLSMDFSRFDKLTPSLDGLWADPFITYKNGTYYLFFEDAIYDKENADISVMTIAADGTMGDPKPCLIRPYHLSYPFVFFWEGEHYMIPETKSNKTIELYKATRFPDQWEFHSNLMEDVEAVDTTLFFYNNKWWLFASFKQKKWVSINNELSIYYADSPLSKDWMAHPMNPVTSDVRRARPAGRIYKDNGKIIRPSQDSSIRYGYGLRLNEIVTLTETDYEEREIDFIEPKWEKMLRGTHTLAHAKNLTVIDVLEWRFRFL